MNGGNQPDRNQDNHELYELEHAQDVGDDEVFITMDKPSSSSRNPTSTTAYHNVKVEVHRSPPSKVLRPVAPAPPQPPQLLQRPHRQIFRPDAPPPLPPARRSSPPAPFPSPNCLDTAAATAGLLFPEEAPYTVAAVVPVPVLAPVDPLPPLPPHAPSPTAPAAPPATGLVDRCPLRPARTDPTPARSPTSVPSSSPILNNQLYCLLDVATSSRENSGFLNPHRSSTPVLDAEGLQPAPTPPPLPPCPCTRASSMSRLETASNGPLAWALRAAVERRLERVNQKRGDDLRRRRDELRQRRDI